MASIKQGTTKAGKIYYDISVHLSHDGKRMKKRWYPPEGWSKKSIDKALQKEAAEFERACNEGEIISRTEQKERARQEELEAAKIQTLRQYGEQVFMPAKEITMAEASRSSFQGYLNNTIYPALGDFKLPEITSAQITALLLSVQKSGKSHATVIKVYTIVNLLFKMAYMDETITKNPMDKVSRPKPRKDEGQDSTVEAYSVEELRHILNCLQEEPLKWQTYITLSAETGMRRGEVCGLRWTDVDLAAGQITVNGSLNYTPQKGVYRNTPKNGRSRIVPIGDGTAALLRSLRAEQSMQAISSYVFTQDNSPEPMHPDTPTRYFAKFGKKYGIEKFHPHKLRHTFASVAITNGADIASVSEILGHTDKAVTLRMYTHADEESKKRALNIVQDALRNVM